MKSKVDYSLKTRFAAAVAVIALLATMLATCAFASDTDTGVEKDKAAGSFATSIPGSGIEGRQLLGICSHDVEEDLKAKIPADQWQYMRNVRLNIPWAAIEKGRGSYSWSYSDKKINDALSIGVNAILITISGPIPVWASDPNTPNNPQMGPPKDPNDFYNFCKAFAERYKGYVDFYQIWQEPGWDLDAPPSKENPPVIYFNGYCEWNYIGMLRAAYKGIKEANPEAFVIPGGMLNGITRDANAFTNYELLLGGGNQDVSMKVQADRNIVAERPMYFNYHSAWPGGTVELGTKEPKTVWFLAEGATHPGFEEWICIQNPGDTDSNVMITYMFPGGATQEQGLTVKAHSRFTVDVNAAVGPYKDVSAKIESSEPVVVERPMYFNYHNQWPGGSIESGVNELSDTWYLAEGATHPGFEEWISLMNPGVTNTDVTITYMFPGGATQEQNISMAPTSRETILVNDIVGPGKDVSAKVEATNEIIAERPMYFLYHGAWPGGHSQVGAIAPGTSWFLAEGTTRSNDVDGAFEEWISIQNPGDTKAKVDVTYMFNGGGTKNDSVEVPAHSRETVFVNEEVGANMDVSVQLDSDEPVVVERPMYFSYHNAWAGGTDELGCQASGQTWYFAEGTTRSGFEEWLTLQNPNGEAATATITFMFADGTTQQKNVGLPANSRTTVGVNQSVSMATICDGVALHCYDYPDYWSWYYNYLKDILARKGYPGREIVVTEIGWPHSGRAEFSPEGQRQAIGDQGVGSLWGAGCRKIWIYEDVDDPPEEVFDANFGLFYPDGSATPAWSEYLRWQSILLDYGNKPTSL